MVDLGATDSLTVADFRWRLVGNDWRYRGRKGDASYRCGCVSNDSDRDNPCGYATSPHQSALDEQSSHCFARPIIYRRAFADPASAHSYACYSDGHPGSTHPNACPTHRYARSTNYDASSTDQYADTPGIQKRKNRLYINSQWPMAIVCQRFGKQPNCTTFRGSKPISISA